MLCFYSIFVNATVCIKYEHNRIKHHLGDRLWACLWGIVQTGFVEVGRCTLTIGNNISALRYGLDKRKRWALEFLSLLPDCRPTASCSHPHAYPQKQTLSCLNGFCLVVLFQEQDSTSTMLITDKTRPYCRTLFSLIDSVPW